MKRKALMEQLIEALARESKNPSVGPLKWIRPVKLLGKGRDAYVYECETDFGIRCAARVASYFHTSKHPTSFTAKIHSQITTVKSPHLVHYFGALRLKCNTIFTSPDHPKLTTEVKQRLRFGSEEVLLLPDKAGSTVKTWGVVTMEVSFMELLEESYLSLETKLNGVTLWPQIKQSLFLQGVGELARLQAAYGFEHNDLNKMNLMVRPTELKECVYGSHKVELFGYLLVIIDFDLARIQVPSTSETKSEQKCVMGDRYLGLGVSDLAPYNLPDPSGTTPFRTWYDLGFFYYALFDFGKNPYTAFFGVHGLYSMPKQLRPGGVLIPFTPNDLFEYVADPTTYLVKTIQSQNYNKLVQS